MKGKRKRAKASRPAHQTPKAPARPKQLDKPTIPLPTEKRGAWFQTKWFVVACVALFGVLGSCATLYQLGPRISITPSGLLAPANSLSTQFEIANNGYLDAKDVSVECEMNDLDLSGMHSSMRNIRFGGGTWSMARLRSGEKAMLPLNRSIRTGKSPSTADVTWKISYKIRILAFIGNIKFAQRFASVTNYSGSIQWNAVPSN